MYVKHVQIYQCIVFFYMTKLFKLLNILEEIIIVSR